MLSCAPPSHHLPFFSFCEINTHTHTHTPPSTPAGAGFGGGLASLLDLALAALLRSLPFPPFALFSFCEINTHTDTHTPQMKDPVGHLCPCVLVSGAVCVFFWGVTQKKQRPTTPYFIDAAAHSSPHPFVQQCFDVPLATCTPATTLIWNYCMPHVQCGAIRQYSNDRCACVCAQN